MAEPFLIRDFFSPDIVRKIAKDIKREYTLFDEKGFLKSTVSKLENQTYSERKGSITDALITYLPDEYSHAVEILLKVTPPNIKANEALASTSRFYVSAFTSFVSKVGLEHYDVSVNALYEMTKSFTSEWDIRPFLLMYPDKTLKILHRWATDENEHVRRLVSEGTRPNLPWGKKLKFVDENPEQTTLPLLEILCNDPSEYVRKSVANHLNDLSKNNPDIVVRHLTKWSKNRSSIEIERLINQALRTLIKQGHKGALSLIGYDDKFNLEVDIEDLSTKVKWGERFDFTFSVKNKKQANQKVLIDYIIGFQKKDGSISNKVFKLKKIELSKNEIVSISKSFSFKPITTRVYYPGLHTVSVQINGIIVSTSKFELLKP